MSEPGYQLYECEMCGRWCSLSEMAETIEESLCERCAAGWEDEEGDDDLWDDEGWEEEE